jgi:hypothetical protein
MVSCAIICIVTLKRRKRLVGYRRVSVCNSQGVICKKRTELSTSFSGPICQLVSLDLLHILSLENKSFRAYTSPPPPRPRPPRTKPTQAAPFALPARPRRFSPLPFLNNLVSLSFFESPFSSCACRFLPACRRRQGGWMRPG